MYLFFLNFAISVFIAELCRFPKDDFWKSLKIPLLLYRTSTAVEDMYLNMLIISSKFFQWEPIWPPKVYNQRKKVNKDFFFHRFHCLCKNRAQHPFPPSCYCATKGTYGILKNGTFSTETGFVHDCRPKPAKNSRLFWILSYFLVGAKSLK